MSDQPNHGEIRAEMREALGEFKKDMRREVILLFAAATPISGVIAGVVAGTKTETGQAVVSTIFNLF